MENSEMEENKVRLCKCGCGEEVTNPKAMYIAGHYARTKEFKEKMSRVHKGKIVTQETREKQRQNVLGKKLSEETKNKIGKSVLGRKNGFYGKNHNIETRKVMKEKWEERKQSSTFKMRMEIHSKQHSIKMKELWEEGVYNSKEYRKKLSEGSKRAWKDPDSIYNSKEHRKKVSENAKNQFKDPKFLKIYQERMQAAPNKLELKMISILERLYPSKFKFVGDHSFWIDGKNPDFVDVQNKFVIEVFGGYWHSEQVTGENEQIAEKNRINHFNINGYKALIIWESEFSDINCLVKKIKQFIERVD